MYVSFEQNAVLNQGDIINDVVCAYLPHIYEPTFILGNDEIERDLTQPFNPDEDLLVLTQAVKSPVMIITQGCDIDNRNYITVARIIPFDDQDYLRGTREEKKAKHILNNYQRLGVRPTYYYLQPSLDNNFPRSVVSFLELHTINKTVENLEYLKQNRILRLMKEAVEDLQFRLSFFFGRFAAITDDYMLTEAERQLVRPPAVSESPQASLDTTGE